MAKQDKNIPSFDDTVPVGEKVPSFEDTTPVETPVKKKEQTLGPSESQSQFGDTNLQGASTFETPQQKSERLSYGTAEKPIPKIVSPPPVDLNTVKNIDPAILSEHINNNINESIAAKKDAQAIFDQKQAELSQLQAQADQLAQQYDQADEQTKAQIQAQIKEIQDRIPDYDLAINQATEEINKQNKVIAYQENVLDAINKANKKQNQSYLGELYGSLESGSASLGEGIARAPSFLYDIFALPQNLVAEYTGAPIEASAEGFAQQWGLPKNEVARYYGQIIENHQKQIQQKYDKGITEYFKNGEIENGLKLLGNQIVESAPISISLAMGNAAGASGVTSTLTGGVVFGAQKKEELDKNSTLSEAEKTTNALSTGLLEGMFEQAGITKLGGLAKEAFKEGGKDVAKELAEKSFKEVYMPIAKKYLGNTAEEVVSEAATQFSQNAVDKYSGYRPDINLMDGVVDAGLVGLGSSFAFSSPIAAKEVIDTKRAISNIPPKQNIVQELLTSSGDRIDTQNKAIFEKVQEFKENPASEDRFQERLKAEMELGQITPEEVDQINQVMGAVMSLDEKVPDVITDNTIRLAAVNLLAERTEIEKSIENKDKALTIPQQERIKLIDAQLGALSQGATVEQALNINIKKEENGNKETKIGDGTAVQEPNKSTEQATGNNEPESISRSNREEEIRIEENVPTIGEGTAEEINQKLSKETDNLIGGQAAENRKTGQYVKDGITYARNKPIVGLSGNKGEVRFTNEISLPFTYKIIEAEELQPSHEGGLRNPKHFIPEAQPKNRNDVGSLQAEESFATNPRFEELGENTNAYSGAPVVNDKGEVIQGNNRSAGLKKGYRNNNPKYKEQLAVNAIKFGITPDQLASMKNPVLVREVKVTDEAAIELGNYDVKDLETGGKRRIDPIATTRRIPFDVKGKITSLLFKGDDVTLNASIRTNTTKLMELMSPYINQAQRNSIFKEGELTDVGIKDIEDIVKHFLFSDSDIELPELYENLSHVQKEGLRKALPYLFSTGFDKGIIPEVQNAIIGLNAFNESGATDFNLWQNQTDMFNEGKTPKELYTPTEMAIIKLLNEAENQKDITSKFAEYSDYAKGTEGDMFKEPILPKTKKEAIKLTFKTDYNDKNQTINKISSPEVGRKEISETRNPEAKKEITNLNPQENAIQKPETGAVLQRQPEETGKTGGERSGVEPSVKREKTSTQSEAQKEEKVTEHKLAQRVEKSKLLPNEIKESLKLRGTTFISKSLEMSKKEANEIVKNYSDAGMLDELENFVLNQTSDIKGDVRTVLLTQLANKYVNLSTTEPSPELKEQYAKRAVDIIYAGQKFGEQTGRALNAHKEWSVLTGKNPETAVVGVQKELDNRNAPVMDQYSNAIKDAQTLLRQLLETEEGKAIIEEKVSEALKNKGKKNIFNRTAQERKDKIAELKERWKTAGKGTLSSSVIGLDKERFEIAVELGAEYLAAGVVNFAKWSKKMIDDLGLTEDQAKGVWDNGKLNKDSDESERTFSKFAEDSKVENNKKTAERLKVKLGNLDQLIKSPDKAIKALEDRKKILEGRDAKPEEIQAVESEIKQTKKLIGLIEKLDQFDDKKKKQILGESIDSIVKNGYLSDVAFKNIFAKALGLDYLTDQDAKNIKNFATTIREADIAGEKFLANPSKENQRAYNVSLYKARQANAKLSEYFKKPKSLFGLLATFIQGNLLTPLSIVTNFYANSNMIPIRFAKKAVASVTDWALSQAAKLKNGYKYERTHDIIANMKGSFPGAWTGTKEGIKQLKTGALPEDILNRDLSTSLHPITAIKRFYDGLKGEEKKAFNKHLNDLVEGTLGIAPETMFRLLNLGDKPFRRAAQSGALREQAAIRGLKGEELTKFLEMPPEEVADLVEQLGQEATFQDSNFISEWLRSKTPAKGWVADLIKFSTVSQAPYVKTPVNIALETFNYAIPVIPLIKSIHYAKNGNRRLALDNWGKAVTGFMILYVVKLLVENGLLSGGEEDDKKKRNAQYAQYLYDKPNMLNMSGLNRLLNGSNPKAKDGDYKIDIKKLGIVGSVMSAAQNVMKSDEGKDINKSAVEQMALMVPSTLKSSFDQSFLSGTNTLLNAMQGGDYDLRKWLISTTQTLGASVLPNTIATLSKADDEFFRDTKDVEIGQNIINVYKNKLFKGGELPTLVNMWGDPIKNTPTDRNSWVYYLLDVTKGEKVDRNQFGIQIYDLYKQTDNPEALPSSVSRTIRINKKTIPLPPDQYELLSKDIGQARKAEVSALLQTEEWRTGDDESKIEMLKTAYNNGRKNGIQLFKESTGIKDMISLEE